MIFMFSTVYRVTQKDFYAHRSDSLPVHNSPCFTPKANAALLCLNVGMSDDARLQTKRWMQRIINLKIANTKLSVHKISVLRRAGGSAML
jgi:hypothetical protein